MINLRLLAGLAITVGLVGLAGCGQPLNYEKDDSVEPTEVKEYPVDPPRSQQQVEAKVTSKEHKISAYLVLEENSSKVKATLLNDKEPDSKLVLSKQDNVTEASISATIPAKTGYSLFVKNKTGKKASIHVQMKGK